LRARIRRVTDVIASRPRRSDFNIELRRVPPRDGAKNGLRRGGSANISQADKQDFHRPYITRRPAAVSRGEPANIFRSRSSPILK
jgi:hypothetical protein